MMTYEARVTLVARPESPPGCELCGTDSDVPSVAVVVANPRGSVVELAACDRCVRALRRLAAISGGHAAFGRMTPARLARSLGPKVSSRLRPAGSPVLVHEFLHAVRDENGRLYMPRAYALRRKDNTWEGWLEFVAVGSPEVLRTRPETTQKRREDVDFWASGLEPTYLEGAFERARARHAAETAKTT
jgi:hypothetical protein